LASAAASPTFYEHLLLSTLFSLGTIASAQQQQFFTVNLVGPLAKLINTATATSSSTSSAVRLAVHTLRQQLPARCLP